MNPIDAMLKVLRTLSAGGVLEARSTHTGAVLSSLKGDGPCWQVESEMVASGHAPIGAQDPLIRRVILPIVRAQRILGDETNARRFAQARASIEKCEAADWRDECLRWLEQMEKGQEQ